MESKQPIEVFFSYSHEDEKLKNDLLNHLSVLRRQNVISAWHDRKIGAGGEWAREIDSHLGSARIILLLVSANFLASDYCYDIEMKAAMERHELGEACVIPVILRPADWSRAVFAKLKALPRDGKPVTTWSNLDEAFADVARGIRVEVEVLLERQVSLLIEKLKKAESLGNWANVVTLGERILQLLPDHPLARKTTARGLVGRWKKNLSIDSFGGVKAYLRQSDRAKISTEDGDDAFVMRIVADLTRAIALDPTNPDYYYIRSGLHPWGAKERKIADLNRAIELKPHDAKYLVSRGRLLELEDKEAALRDYKEVLSLGFQTPVLPPLLEIPPGLERVWPMDNSPFRNVEFESPFFKDPINNARLKIDDFRIKQQIADDLEKIWGPEV
jgi:hypothetical protein